MTFWDGTNSISSSSTGLYDGTNLTINNGRISAYSVNSSPSLQLGRFGGSYTAWIGVDENTNLNFYNNGGDTALFGIRILSGGTQGQLYSKYHAGSGNRLIYGTSGGNFENASVTSPLFLSGGSLSINQSTTSQNGFLSSTDWNTFNAKQNALTNPITGTGTSGTFPILNGTTSLTNSTTTDNGSTVTIGSRALAIGTIASLGSAATNFLTSNGGTINQRTAAQVLSDLPRATLTNGRGILSNSGTYNVLNDRTFYLDTTKNYNWLSTAQTYWAGSGDFDGSFQAGFGNGDYQNFYASSASDGYLGANSVFWEGTGKFNIGGNLGSNQTFTPAITPTAIFKNGFGGGSNGSTFFTRTQGTGAGESGLAIDGSYSGGLSTINIWAMGPYTSGGYASALKFKLTNNASSRDHAVFNSDGSSDFNGAVKSTSYFWTNSGIYSNTFGIYIIPQSGYWNFNGAGITGLGQVTTGTLYSNGGTVTTTAPSDSTLKNTIKDYRYGLSQVLQLKPKTFYFNSDTAKSSLKYGFLAQEVRGIMPDAVRKLNPKDPNSKLGLEPDAIYVAMVNAIKELKQQIDNLKAEIIILKNK